MVLFKFVVLAINLGLISYNLYWYIKYRQKINLIAMLFLSMLAVFSFTIMK